MSNGGSDQYGIQVWFVDTEIYRHGRKETSFDFEVFNGVAFREGKVWPFEETAWVETENPTSLQLVHSGLCHPAVMQPSSNLVVIEEVARKLETVPHVKLLPVEFLKVVAVGMYDPRQFTRPAGEEAADFLKGLPDDPRLRAEMPKYYELLSARLHTIWDQYETTTIEFKYSASGNPIKICAKMFDDYPAINRSGTLLSPRVAEIVVPELDRRFFKIRKLRIPE